MRSSPNPYPSLARFAISIIAGTAPALAIDNNSNGLSDIWEQRFDAGSLTQLGDEDGDGYNNVEECIAGTDPFDSASRPFLNPAVMDEGKEDFLCLAFDTVEGKHYLVRSTFDLADGFEQLGQGWFGDAKKRDIFYSDDETYKTRSPARFEFWADVSGSSIEAIDNLANYTDEPDGVLYNGTPSAPSFLATGYAARMTTAITVSTTGYYRLYLSSGGPAELYMATEIDGNAQDKIAEVLPTQTGLEPGEWTTYGTQQTDLILFEADKAYRIEMRYLANVPSQHCAIAWSGPGISGIEEIGYEDLAQTIFRNKYIPRTALLEHDYDSSGQTSTLWPENTAIQGALVGMTGNVERLTGDPGNSSAERIVFNSGSSDHLYATWLYNMATGHNDMNLLFMDGSDSSKEGPRIALEERSSNTIAAVRAGGSGGDEVQIDTRFDHSYRVEIVATVADEGFQYATPEGFVNVEKDRFDIYVSDMSSHLIGSAKGLTFRDGSDVLNGFSVMQATFFNSPLDIAFDDFEITSGHISGSGYLVANHTVPAPADAKQFYKLDINEVDQDGDGLPDWEELALAEFNEVLFFDAETNNGTSDVDTLNALLGDSQGLPDVMLYGTDADAYESNFPNTIPNNAEITLTRTGTLAPLEVKLCIVPLENTGNVNTVCDGSCCMLIGSAGDEEVELEDYQLIDEDGNIIADTVQFGFGEMEKVLTVRAVNDAINEYPETLNIAVEDSADNSYTTSELLNGASIQIFDLPDSPDNISIFTGTFSQDGNAVIATNGSGFVTVTINGPRTEIRIWDEFSGLTSAQQDSHIHKANPGNTPGPITYSITETPGDETTDPLNGPLVSYPWVLTESSGAVPTAGGSASKQVLIDSLFGQNGETPLYLNVHTVDNPAGEIWAFLGISGGSATDPGDAAAPAAPGSAEYPQLSGDLLKSEVRRFLNQATFGATDAEVASLLQTIEQARIGNSSYHRNNAFAEWIDAQINTVDQTYMLEYTLASHYQFMTLANIFDPTLNPPQQDWNTPLRPTQWPVINRDDPNPEHWYLDATYPVERNDFRLAGANGLNAEPGNTQRREAHWQLMINAHDQLRQKMGFALQQIAVVSDTLQAIRDTPYGSTNYQDMLNTYAFEHYRDVLGFVNWSPLMGKWLSSLQNQKAIDFDEDGLYDAFPDENLARENMQLFSIGLFDLWSDGTLKLSPEGLPRATYTNDDIREFAKVLTGQSFSRHNGYFDTWGGTPFVADNTNFAANQGSYGVLGLAYLYPMKMFGDFHSTGPKTFAGVTVDNTGLTDLTQQGIADIEAAIDWLAGKPDDGLPDYDMVNSHVSTPAFISRRLIQRFTTSNPSQDYLHRVASAFKNSEGDLGQTIRAILLDPEARNIDINETTFGLKKSPLEGYLQLLRSLEAYTYIPMTDPEGASPFDQAPGDFSNPDLYLGTFDYPSDQLDNHSRNVRFKPGSTISSFSRGLQMDPFSQVTVFNYYLPDYSPGGVIGNAGLVSPEMQLATEPDIIRNINYFEDIIRSTTGPFGDELGGNNANQIAAFGGDSEASSNDGQRLARQALADAFYPATEPASQLTTEASGLTESAYGSSASAPYWVRLSRTGDVFVTSESSDGVNWTQVSVEILQMAEEVFIGLATTSHNDGTLTTAEFSNVTVTGGEGNWFNTDVGDVSASGSTSSTGANSFELQASGNDIWNSNDEFHFAYQLLDGDAEVITRVDSLQVTNPWAKAGVMIRETLKSDSANVFMYVSGSNGTRAQIRRVERGRSSESIADEALLDELDDRLTNGLFRVRYPYDMTDNDDPNVHGLDDRLKNPREMIIDALTNAYGDPYNGSNDDSDRLNKFSDALYLLTFSPEYQIKK
ncbi:MAG: DUF1800 family protein [Verrucomicrobiota bacterium]